MFQSKFSLKLAHFFGTSCMKLNEKQNKPQLTDCFIRWTAIPNWFVEHTKTSLSVLLTNLESFSKAGSDTFRSVLIYGKKQEPCKKLPSSVGLTVETRFLIY